MSGLKLMGGLSMSGTSSTAPAQYGTGQSYDSVSAAAFGPGVTAPAENVTSALHPAGPTGMAFWVGVASVVALVAIRYSLPN